MSVQHHRPDPSLPAVVAGAVAAATATALSSRLGLLGTIVGAAVASIVTAVVAAGLGGWLERLHRAVVRREPGPFVRIGVGLGAIGLVVLAFQSGWQLLTSDLPPGSLAARMLTSL